MRMKKLFGLFFISIFGLFVFFSGVVGAVEEDVVDVGEKTVNLYFFWGDGCPHCEREKPFLEKLDEKYPGLKVYQHEIWKNAENRKLMVEFGKKLDAVVTGVPFTVVGDEYFIGWLDEKNTGAQIEEAVINALKNGSVDVGEQIENGGESESVTGGETGVDGEMDELEDEVPSEQATQEKVEEREDKVSPIPESLTLPLIGELKTKDLSLPLLTILIGGLDGFNPCAMWTLVFLISLLLGMENRRRMWVLGTTFIVASAGVYFLFLSAWLNLLLFIGFIFWVRVVIALVALGGGGYYLKQYFFNPHATCAVTGTEKRQRVFEKLRILTHEKHFWIAFGGIILLAAAVNLVELICSAGLPAVYTQILTLSELPAWQYYGYLLLYIFVFMLDDLIVFILAMVTLKITGISDKYSHASHLIGGVAMVVIGLLLLLKPEWLMFG